MPPPAFLDPSKLDFSNIVADKSRILQLNPQRHEFALLDGVVHCDRENHIFAGYHDVRSDAWWVRGHIPGRPIFPGVLMIETAAQLASFLTHEVMGDDRFIGFAGVDEAKFRGIVEPPCRLVIIGKARQIKPRRIICDTQGFVGDTMVFEAVISGMPV